VGEVVDYIATHGSTPISIIGFCNFIEEGELNKIEKFCGGRRGVRKIGFSSIRDP
jgi:hypothetical protein